MQKQTTVGKSRTYPNENQSILAMEMEYYGNQINTTDRYLKTDIYCLEFLTQWHISLGRLFCSL